MKKPTEEKVFHCVNTLIILLVCVLCVLPLIYVLFSSLNGGAAPADGRSFFRSVRWTTAAYKLLATAERLHLHLANSIVVTLVGSLLSLAATVLCAYPLSKRYLWQRRKISFLMTFTMIFSGGMIPTFLTVRSLGLMNSYLSLWLTGLINTYNMMLMRSFFERLPRELDEAARIDGCGEWRLLVQICLPLSKACLASIGLLYAVSYWNMYQKVILYIQDSSKHTLPVFIQQNVFELQQLNLDSVDASSVGASGIAAQSVRSASVIVLIVPMIIVYPFVQKYFASGITFGALKG